MYSHKDRRQRARVMNSLEDRKGRVTLFPQGSQCLEMGLAGRRKPISALASQKHSSVASIMP